MTFGEMLKAISEPDDIEKSKAMNMDVEFCTINRHGLSLLSVYESGGKICIDIGTSEDCEQHNKEVSRE